MHQQALLNSNLCKQWGTILCSVCVCVVVCVGVWGVGVCTSLISQCKPRLEKLACGKASAVAYFDSVVDKKVS
jgi:hypothetical protein